MRGGTNALLLAGLALAGCAGGPKAVEIRPVADPGAKLAAGDIAAAKGQLALGNTGLALEAFRKIQRDRPNDPEALSGIGDCYAVMGRFDLAQSNYEAALAVAPHDRRLLLGLAVIYQRQGDSTRAAELQQELAVQSATAAAAPAAANAQVDDGTTQRASAALSRLGASSITVALPPARPAATLDTREAVNAPSVPAAVVDIPQRVRPQLASSVTVALPPARPPVTLDTREAVNAPAVPVVAEKFTAESRPSLSSTITVALPPARPAPSRPAERHPDVQLASMEATGPRLVRLSRGEVALVTTGRPLWGSDVASRTMASAALRWVPLDNSGPPPNVQVLNAARHQGLAASARTVLLDRGWRRIAVGDAPMTRETSVVYYPKDRATLGRSLAAQFGVTAREVRGNVLVLVLGRDAPDLVASQRKS